jgi:putative methionine-R-sulfoxide reductase with GAF domain
MARIQVASLTFLEGELGWSVPPSQGPSLCPPLPKSLATLPCLEICSPRPGFYVLDPSTPRQLILGPFHGKVACQTIKFGKGVCGTAVEKSETQLVADCEAFPGHIACDGDSKSEIVVPISMEGEVVAIIDIDCAELKGFDEVDRKALEELAVLLGKACDW